MSTEKICPSCGCSPGAKVADPEIEIYGEEVRAWCFCNCHVGKGELRPHQLRALDELHIKDRWLRMEQENKALKEILRRAEWGTEGMCPVCAGSENYDPGHTPDCELARLLKGEQ